MRTTPRRSGALIRLAMAALFSLALPAAATSPAPEGCPLFHCAAEATGVMSQPLVQVPTRLTLNGALGAMKAQGCSGDGHRLACLFVTDAVTGAPGKGTLKLLNGTTLQPVWGSADTPESRELDGPSAGGGQVPYIFANGRIAAGDASVHALYEADGRLVATAALAGRGNNLGLTPLGNDLGVVSQTDGFLTLIDLSSWSVLGSLKLRDPMTRAALALVSPSASTGNTLYAVARNSQTNRGFLLAVQLDSSPSRLRLRARFEFVGKTGASAVVIKPSQTALSGNLVLLHAPSLVDDAQPIPRLLGVLDPGAGALKLAWSIPLTDALRVSPTIDDQSRTLFFSYGPDARVYQANYVNGAAVREFDIRALGGFASGFVLNGHLAAIQSTDGFTMLLTGSVAGASAKSGQYLMAFRPDTSTLLWAGRTQARADSYTGAWSLVPSAVPGVACPVVMGSPSGLTRVCDF